MGIGGGRNDRTPATPPGMRVRTGRFEGLRSCGSRGTPSWSAVADREDGVEEHPAVAPPTAGIARHLGRDIGF